MKRKLFLAAALILVVASFCTVFLTACGEVEDTSKAISLEINKKNPFAHEELILKKGKAQVVNLIADKDEGIYYLAIKNTTASPALVNINEIRGSKEVKVDVVKIASGKTEIIPVNMKNATAQLQGCGMVSGYQKASIEVVSVAGGKVQIAWAPTAALAHKAIR